MRRTPEINISLCHIIFLILLPNLSVVSGFIRLILQPLYPLGWETLFYVYIFMVTKNNFSFYSYFWYLSRTGFHMHPVSRWSLWVCWQLHLLSPSPSAKHTAGKTASRDTPWLSCTAGCFRRFKPPPQRDTWYQHTTSSSLSVSLCVSAN